MFNKKVKTAKKVEKSEAPVKEAVVKEPQTLEEAKEQIATLQEKLTPTPPPKPTAEELEKKEKQMMYFKELSRGAKFIEFIINDLNKAGYNRAKRRRIISELMNKKFSKEFVEMYENKVDQIVKFLESELNLTAGEDIKQNSKIEIVNRKVFTVKPPVDAVDLLKKDKDDNPVKPTPNVSNNDNVAKG